MGIRCLTIVEEVRGPRSASSTDSMTGYPTGHGAELKSFLVGMRIVNGLRLGDQIRMANGMDCLAAQLIAHFKTEPGGFYLYPAGRRDCGEEYIYTVYTNAGKLMIRVEAGAVTFFGLPGTKQVNMPILYDGEIESFDPEAVERLWRTGGRDQIVNDLVDDVVLSSDTFDIPEDSLPKH